MKLQAGLLLLAVTCSTTMFSADDARRASLIQIIAYPEAFDGQRVLVTGYLELLPEGSEIYVHQEDAEHKLIMNGIRIRESAVMTRDSTRLNHKYALIVGTFHAAPKNIVHPAVGTIDSITEQRLWPD